MRRFELLYVFKCDEFLYRGTSKTPTISMLSCNAMYLHILASDSAKGKLKGKL